jgi:hypothetical protein
VPGLLSAFTGDVITAADPGYDEVRRPVQVAFGDVFPRLVLRCRTVDDVVTAIGHARASGERVAVRGGGHCFAGRSSTDGVLIDLAHLDRVAVTGDEIAVIGGGARLGLVYSTLHAAARTLPAGCGATVGIGGLTLGGGIGLLGRRHGLTCDRLVGAQVVLADGQVVDCDERHHPELFWALRGAGGAQFGIVTELRFATVPEPRTTRVELHWTAADLAPVLDAWQRFAPAAPDDVTLGLTITAEPGRPVRATVLGAATLGEAATRAVLEEFLARTPPPDAPPELQPGLPYHRLKTTLTDPREAVGHVRIRSEFFARPLVGGTVVELLRHLAAPGASRARRLTFTPMAGAYDHVAADATAFAHRGARFLLEHVGASGDSWIDRSWAAAAVDGSGQVYPNFPDPLLADPALAYHGANLPRLVAIKNAYDPDRVFDFPQAIPSTERQS